MLHTTQIYAQIRLLWEHEQSPAYKMSHTGTQEHRAEDNVV